jgi:hypothetical protein
MTLTPNRADAIWLGLVLLALGTLGFLDAAGVLNANETIGGWWPVAVVGWAMIGMVAARHVTAGGIVVAGIGLALLADAQQWALRGVAWSATFAFIGAWILFSILRGGRDAASSSASDGWSCFPATSRKL